MKDWCLEEHDGWSVGVVDWKFKGEFESEAGVGCVDGASDRGSPEEEVLW